ncbi:45212_t:CDS:2, partial [Gigaspora margarita]
MVALKILHEKYGDLYEFYMGNSHIIITSRPDLIEQVWAPSSIKNTKFILRHSYSKGIDELDLSTKGMLFNRNIEVWALNKKFLNTISALSFLRKSIELSNKIIDEIFDYWKIIEKKGIKIEISKWTDTLDADIFLDNRDWIDQKLIRIVSEKRKEIENTHLDQPLEPNILTLLLTTNTKRDLDKISVGKFDRPLTDNKVKSIIREVFLSGLDTTSNSLAFIVFYLAKHRDIYLKVREE